MRIGEREIGVGERAYVIAEIGVNHDGDPARALSLTEDAARAGADAIKLQFFETDRLTSGAARLAAYQASAGETDPLTMLRRLELAIEDMAPVVDRAHELGIHAIVTVFSVELVEVAQSLAWDAYKTASPDIVHRPLLDRLAETGRPMIVSTGASTLDEVERAAGWLGSARDRLAFLQCVSAYPAPASALDGIGAIAGATGLTVGYSDHTQSEDTGGEAVERGAAILEKHLTYDRGAAGPDHAASLEPEGLARYVGLAQQRAVSQPTGIGEKHLLDVERDVRRVSRQSIVAARAIRSGEVIGPSDVTFKRPGTGLEPWRVGELVGRCASRDVAVDAPFVEADGVPVSASESA